MTEKRFVGEEDSDYIRDNKTDERALYLCDWLNKLNGLSDENEQLKQDIGYLEEKIKENEWHWNTIDEDRDVWHYKCTEAEKRVKELKTENEQLKKEKQGILKRIDDYIWEWEDEGTPVADEMKGLKKDIEKGYLEW